MPRIFISYKRADKEKVFAIKDKIEVATGEKCWIDLDGIESDAQFANVIIKAIDEADIFLFIYSKQHSKIKDYEKDWTVREINYAQTEGKRIVFVNIDKTPLTKWFKFMFSSKQQVDATSSEAFDHLLMDICRWLNIIYNNKFIPDNRRNIIYTWLRQYSLKAFGILCVAFLVSASLVLLNKSAKPISRNIYNTLPDSIIGTDHIEKKDSIMKKETSSKSSRYADKIKPIVNTPSKKEPQTSLQQNDTVMSSKDIEGQNNQPELSYYIYFKENQANIDDSGLITLNMVAESMERDTLLYALITAYGNNVEAPSEETQLALRRVENVKKELTEWGGISSKYLYSKVYEIDDRAPAIRMRRVTIQLKKRNVDSPQHTK